MTWGDVGPKGERSMSWKMLGRDLEAQLGCPPLSIFGITARYGLVLDLENDRLTVPDPKAFAGRLRADLEREG